MMTLHACNHCKWSLDRMRCTIVKPLELSLLADANTHLWTPAPSPSLLRQSQHF